MENATSFAFELDKPYTVQRDDEEEITVCSKGGSSSNPQEKDNVLHYRTEVPIRVRIQYKKLSKPVFGILAIIISCSNGILNFFS